MANLINENTKIVAKKDGLYIDGKFIVGFESIKRCKTHSLNIYAYVDLTNWNTETPELNIKVGWAKTGVYNRYKDQNSNPPWKRVIGLWHVDSDKVADTFIHKFLQDNSKYYKKDKLYHWNENEANRTEEDDEDIKGSTELYVIDSIEGIKQLKDDITKCTKSEVELEEVKLYKDIRDLVVEIKKENERNNILYLCTRWGKTNTILELAKLHNDVDNVRITIMAAYVGTVRNSYKQNCTSLKNYSNILFVDPDDYYNAEEELFNDIKKHLMANPKNHVMFYVALTGDKNAFERRISVLKDLSFINKELVIEEADFGSHCENQLNKIKKIEKMNISYNYITTGTGWDKVKKISDILGDVKLYKREYLKDVLGK